MPPVPRPRTFRTPAAWRAWLAKNHASKDEIWIRYYKVASGKTSVLYREALDEALCFGWIDGKVRSIDAESYMQRWTPRRKGSYWSAVNVEKAKRLIAEGRMARAGLAAFEARDVKAAARYSFENRPRDLPRAAIAAMKRDAIAWAFWREQPPGYRSIAAWYVTSAKKEETRARRLARLIACSRRGERLPMLASTPASARKAHRSRTSKRPLHARGAADRKR